MVSEAPILNASILVVDDQEADVSLLERTLRGAGAIRPSRPRWIRTRSASFSARTATA